METTAWSAEWESLSHQITQLETECGTESPQLAAVCHAFHQFSTELFEWFQVGFGNETLEYDRDYTAEYVLRTILNQIGEDLSVLRRVWRDRQYGTEAQRATLHEAEWLSTSALLAVADQGDTAGLIRPSTVFCYFQRNMSVRVIPYANVAFVGIPNTAVTLPNTTLNKRRLLITAHEVGHHVYWHGTHDGQRIHTVLQNTLADQPDWLNAWMEELFSDVYGTLVGSEVMAVVCQAMIRDMSPSIFTHDDQQYPIHALRPYIYIDTLKRALKLTPNLYNGELLNLMEELWEYRIEDNNPSQFLLNQLNNFTVPLDEARRHLEGAIDVIVTDILKPHLTRLHTAWSLGEKSFGERKRRIEEIQQEMDLLYEPFVETVSKLGDQTIPEITISEIENAQLKAMRLLSPRLQDAISKPIPAHDGDNHKGWITLFQQIDWIVGGSTTTERDDG